MLNMGKLDGKIALVTGAARSTGIGFAIAKKFTEDGATVLINDINPAILDRAKELQEMNHKTEGYIADLTNLEEVTSMTDAIIEKFGRIDILCNNAGKSVPPRPSFLEMSEEYFNMVMDRNLKTQFICCKAVVPIMVENKYGRIVNMSSTTGNRVVYRHCSAYAASKGAVSAFTRALALELGEHNIAVNAILPGQIDVSRETWTPDNDTFNFEGTDPIARWPMHRPGFPHEIAKLASFLASNECSYITGGEFMIDGGSSLVEPSTPGKSPFDDKPIK